MFKSGLQEEIRADVKLLKLKNLKDLMIVAFQVEGRNFSLQKVKEERKARSGRSTNSMKWSGFKPTVPSYMTYPELPKAISTPSASKKSDSKEVETTKTSSNKVNIPISTHTSGSSNARGTKRLTEAELNRRRELGLCFKCEEKFGPNHKCKAKQLHLLVMAGDETEEIDERDFVELEAEEVDRSYAMMSLSRTIVACLMSYKTIKLNMEMKGKTMLVLIDNGAIHNFISWQLVKEMDLEVQHTAWYFVTMGDGRNVYSTKEYPTMEMEM